MTPLEERWCVQIKVLMGCLSKFFLAPFHFVFNHLDHFGNASARLLELCQSSHCQLFCGISAIGLDHRLHELFRGRGSCPRYGVSVGRPSSLSSQSAHASSPVRVVEEPMFITCGASAVDVFMVLPLLWESRSLYRLVSQSTKRPGLAVGLGVLLSPETKLMPPRILVPTTNCFNNKSLPFQASIDSGAKTISSTPK